MHFCAVIVHPKELSVVDVREMVGEKLVEKGEADWYSTDNYRERTFNGRVSIPFKEFLEKKDLFKVNDPVVFAFIYDGYIERLQIPKYFYELDRDTDREKILALYQQAFYDTQMRLLNVITEDYKVDDLVVTLLDYHN